MFPSEWRHNMFFATAGCCFSWSQSFAFLGGRRKTQCFLKFIIPIVNAFVNTRPFKPRPTQAYVQGEVQWVKQREEKKKAICQSPVHYIVGERESIANKRKGEKEHYEKREQMFFRGTSKSKSIFGRFFSFSVSISFPNSKVKVKK